MGIPRIGVIGRVSSTEEPKDGGEGEHTVGLDAIVGELEAEVIDVVAANGGGLGTLVEEVKTRV